MLKVTIPKIILIILISAFSLHLSGITVAEECWKSKGGGPTFPGNCAYTPDWYTEFQYDPNNPDEIDRNSSVEISVIGGTSPYTWQVGGTGFSLSEGTTEGLINTLIANDTACGTATISVTDSCGYSCSGEVRGADGHWQLVVNEAIATWDNRPGECLCGTASERISGGSKYQTVWYGGTNMSLRNWNVFGSPNAPYCDGCDYSCYGCEGPCCGCAGFYFDFHVTDEYPGWIRRYDWVCE